MEGEKKFKHKISYMLDNAGKVKEKERKTHICRTGCDTTLSCCFQFE